MGRWIGVVSCDLVRRHSGVQPAPNLSHFRHGANSHAPGDLMAPSHNGEYSLFGGHCSAMRLNERRALSARNLYTREVQSLFFAFRTAILPLRKMVVSLHKEGLDRRKTRVSTPSAVQLFPYSYQPGAAMRIAVIGAGGFGPATVETRSMESSGAA